MSGKVCVCVFMYSYILMSEKEQSIETLTDN